MCNVFFIILAGKHPALQSMLQSQDSVRILLAPDHKIANNLFKLLEEDIFRKTFTAEFPLLHLRKSKIINLLSGYSSAGLLQLTKYLLDTEETDIHKMVRPEKIERATTFVKRVAMVLHIVFMVLFLESLPPEDAERLSHSLDNQNKDNLFSWHDKLFDFLRRGSSVNATFALYADILSHCEEILAIALAEKIGGPDGYALMIAAVKSSLAFSFLNGAQAYAGFCTKLLIEHITAGVFHKNLKERLFTTPFKDSKRNFALDTQREMEHKVSNFQSSIDSLSL